MTTSTALRRTRLFGLVVALVVALTLTVTAPALATESAPEGDDTGKLTISDNPHDQFGLVLFGLMGLAALFAGANIVRQLSGKRPQADGRIRWR